MYKIGDVKIATLSCPQLLMEPGTVYLPHSWGEWIIGGKEQVIDMIDDLKALLGDMP